MIDALDDSDDAFLYNNHIEFADEAAFNEFVTGVAQRSYFVSPADVQYGDKFITLSTCDYDLMKRVLPLLRASFVRAKPWTASTLPAHRSTKIGRCLTAGTHKRTIRYEKRRSLWENCRPDC